MKARGKRDGNLELPDMVAPTLNEGFILAALEKYQRDTKSPGWLARICWHAGVVQAIDCADAELLRREKGAK